MGGHVHRCCQCLRQHAGLCHVVFSLNFHIIKVRPVWTLKTVTMTEVDELQSHIVVVVLLKIDSPNSDSHSALQLIWPVNLG